MHSDRACHLRRCDDRPGPADLASQPSQHSKPAARAGCESVNQESVSERVHKRRKIWPLCARVACMGGKGVERGSCATGSARDWEAMILLGLQVSARLVGGARAREAAGVRVPLPVPSLARLHHLPAPQNPHRSDPRRKPRDNSCRDAGAGTYSVFFMPQSTVSWSWKKWGCASAVPWIGSGSVSPGA